MNRALKKEILLIVLLLLGVFIYLLIPRPRLELEGQEQKIIADAPLLLRFTQAMDKKSVEKVFSMNPERQSRFVWQGRKTLEVYLDGPLKIGEKVRVRLEESMKSIYGKSFRNPVILYFIVTGPPYVKLVSPAQGVIRPDQVITVMFDRPMSPTAETVLLEINPPVEGKVEWISPSVLEFIPKEWPKASLFHLKIPQGIAASAGGSTEKEFTWELETPAPHVLESHFFDEEIRLKFNQEIDLEELKPGNNILLYPSNDLDADKNPRKDGFFNGELIHGEDETILVLKPTFPYLPDTDHRLVLKAGLKGEGELLMAEDFEFPFHTSKEEEKETGLDWISPQDLKVFRGGEDPVFEFKDDAESQEPLTVEWCALDGKTFFEINERLGWKEARCKTPERLHPDKNESPINLRLLTKKELKAGAYLLALQKGEVRITQPFIKNDAFLLLKKFPEELLVWALDFKGNPISGMELILHDRTGKVIAEEFTNEEGLYTLQKELEAGLVVIGKKGKAWAMAGELWQTSGAAVAAPGTLGYLMTDQTIYQPGETLYWYGLYRLNKKGLLELPEKAKIEMRIEDSLREPKATLKSLFGRYGSFHGEWQIPESFSPGRYFVTVDFFPNEEEKSSFEREVVIGPALKGPLSVLSVETEDQKDRKAAPYDLSLSTDRLWGRAGDSITLGLFVLDPEGKGLPGKKINVLMHAQNSSKILFKTVVETEKKPSSLALTLPHEPGPYFIRAEDKEIQIIVASPTLPYPTDLLTLIPDQSEYLLGGKARLLLLPPQELNLPKKALITYERNGLLESKVMLLEKALAPLEILIQETMIPDFLVTASMVDEKSGKLLSKSVQLKVNLRDKEIKMAGAPEILQEGDQKKVTLHLRSYDYQERPLSAQIYLQASTNNLPLENPLDRFYAMRSWTPLRNPGKTLYLNPSLKTDAAGLLTLTFALPPDFSEGEIRAIAVAQEGRFGAVQIPLGIKKTLTLRPRLPAFLVIGDRFTLETEMLNSGEQDLETSIELIAPDLKILGSSEKKVILKKNETVSLRWDAEIGETEKSVIQVAFRTPETFTSHELNVFSKEGRPLEGPDALAKRMKDPNPFLAAYAGVANSEDLWQALESEALTREERSFILWGLSERGDYDTKATLALYQKRGEASLAAQGFLLMNLQELVHAGQKSVQPLIERLKSELASKALTEGDKMFFEETKESLFKSPRKTTELLFSALKKGGPSNPLLPPLEAYLTESQVTEEAQATSDILLQRQVLPVENANLNFLKPGDKILGRLHLFVPQDLRHVVLEEPLPAGFKGPTFSPRLEDPETPAQEEEKAYREGYTFIPNPVWHFDHHEILADRLLLYADPLPPGVYTIEFLMEAAFSGEFYHPPARLYSLFKQDILAVTPEEMIKIQ